MKIFNYLKKRISLTSLVVFSQLMVASCNATVEAEEQTAGIANKTENSTMVIQPSLIPSQPLPELMKALAKEHFEHLLKIDSVNYQDLCDKFQLDADDDGNRQQYVLFLLTHKLLTSQSASNGSMGKILRLPYFWHYATPNPRHEIVFTFNGVSLSNTPPPGEFKQYPNFAGIDRTPFLFLSDAFADQPRYYSPTCDTFSSFGWCSEREMAYTALLKLLGFRGKINTSGVHCWSEFLVAMKTISGESLLLELKVDNTFDVMQWRRYASLSVTDWEKELGTVKQRFWYNKKAKDQFELDRIQSFIVSQATCEDIERRLVSFLNESLNGAEH